MPGQTPAQAYCLPSARRTKISLRQSSLRLKWSDIRCKQSMIPKIVLNAAAVGAPGSWHSTKHRFPRISGSQPIIISSTLSTSTISRAGSRSPGSATRIARAIDFGEQMVFEIAAKPLQGKGVPGFITVSDFVEEVDQPQPPYFHRIVPSRGIGINGRPTALIQVAAVFTSAGSPGLFRNTSFRASSGRR